MATPKEAQEVVTEYPGKALEAASLWADANRQILRELTDLSASTAKEGVRLYAELQSSAFEAVKVGGEFLLRRQGELQGLPKDPLAWYRMSLLEGIEAAQKAFHILEGNAQAVTQSTERLQVTAEQAGRKIQQALETMGGKVKGLYSPSAN